MLDLGLDRFFRCGSDLLQTRRRGFQVGLGLGHGCLGLPGVQGSQNLTGLHPVSLADVDLLHPPLDFGIDHHLKLGSDIPGAQDLFLDQALGCGGNLYHRSLTLHSFFRVLFLGGNDLGRAEGSQPRHSQDRQHDNDSFHVLLGF